MRKVIMTLAICFIFVMAVSFDAQDLKYISGDWYSTSDTNYDGISEVGTTNHNGKTTDVTLRIKDVSSNDYEYNEPFSINDGQSANSGIVWTTELHTMQGQVLTDSTKHSPWFNA